MLSRFSYRETCYGSFCFYKKKERKKLVKLHTIIVISLTYSLPLLILKSWRGIQPKSTTQGLTISTYFPCIISTLLTSPPQPTTPTKKFVPPTRGYIPVLSSRDAPCTDAHTCATTAADQYYQLSLFFAPRALMLRAWTMN